MALTVRHMARYFAELEKTGLGDLPVIDNNGNSLTEYHHPAGDANPYNGERNVVMCFYYENPENPLPRRE